MAIIAVLRTLVTADTKQFSSGMQRAKRETMLFSSAMRTAQTALAGFVSLRAAGSIIKLAADFEQLSVSMEVMLKSAPKAQALLSDIKAFAAATPFELTELANSSKMLLAFGIESEKIIPTLGRLGDIAAGLNIPLGELAELYGKARVQGRLFAQDVNQLTGRGIPVIQQFAKQFGVAESDVRKLVETGKIGFKNLEEAFVSMTSQGGQFFGLMEKQSTTLAGRISTLKDAFAELGRTIGGVVAPALTKLAENLTTATSVIGGQSAGGTSPVKQVQLLGVGESTAMKQLKQVGAQQQSLVNRQQEILKGMAERKFDFLGLQTVADTLESARIDSDLELLGQQADALIRKLEKIKKGDFGPSVNPFIPGLKAIGETIGTGLNAGIGKGVSAVGRGIAGGENFLTGAITTGQFWTNSPAERARRKFQALREGQIGPEAPTDPNRFFKQQTGFDARGGQAALEKGSLEAQRVINRAGMAADPQRDILKENKKANTLLERIVQNDEKNSGLLLGRLAELTVDGG